MEPLSWGNADCSRLSRYLYLGRTKLKNLYNAVAMWTWSRLRLKKGTRKVSRLLQFKDNTLQKTFCHSLIALKIGLKLETPKRIPRSYHVLPNIYSLLPDNRPLYYFGLSTKHIFHGTYFKNTPLLPCAAIPRTNFYSIYVSLSTSFFRFFYIIYHIAHSSLLTLLVRVRKHKWTFICRRMEYFFF